jgi:hypothetical protein
MKKRYIYPLLLLAPGLLFSLIIATLIVGAAAGALWIFVLGDNRWPEAAQQGLALIFPLTFLGLWAAFIIAGYMIGKKLEVDPVLNKKHILLSIVLTLVPLLIIVLHQFSVGNLGKPPISLLCGDFCAEKGYSTSGQPISTSGERSCVCYDNGEIVIEIPMATLLSRESK